MSRLPPPQPRRGQYGVLFRTAPEIPAGFGLIYSCDLQWCALQIASGHSLTPGGLPSGGFAGHARTVFTAAVRARLYLRSAPGRPGVVWRNIRFLRLTFCNRRGLTDRTRTSSLT